MASVAWLIKLITPVNWHEFDFLLQGSKLSMARWPGASEMLLRASAKSLPRARRACQFYKQEHDLN